MKRERRLVCGVEVIKISRNEEFKLLTIHIGESFTNRLHLFQGREYSIPPCFPHLGELKLKMFPELDRVSHFVLCKEGKKKVVCTIGMSEKGIMTYWKGPRHYVGECPFTDYLINKGE